MLNPIFENIPDELTQKRQWVCWREEPRKDNPEKMTKPPYHPNGKKAESNNPQTWSHFLTVKAAYKAATNQLDGVGFVLTQEGGIVGVDFDDCRCPAFDGVTTWANSLETVLPEIADHIRKLNGYTEVSPSGKGIRVFLKGTLPVDGKKKGDFEVYQSGRYVTVTGHVLDEFPRTIEQRQEDLDRFYQVVFSESSKKDPAPQDRALKNTITDGWRDRAFQSRNGEGIKRLFEGDYSAYPSQSDADMALVSHLAFWLNGDPVAIDEAFRESRLYRQKWDEKHYSDGRTYGQVTIEKAIAGCTSFYGDRRSEPSVNLLDVISQPEAWPNPLNEAAFHGLAGEYVKTIEPHTEADAAAILMQLLIAFGNCAGGGPHFLVEADRHGVNEFAVIVGDTAKGRKGTSWGHIREAFRVIDESWMHQRIKNGLSSGEGLICQVRDPVSETGEAPDDKRLLVVEPEFAQPLAVMKREGNTLSPVIRQAWDSETLAIMTKNFPSRATNPHVSMICHITLEEQRKRMTDTEAFNGFANRFIWILARRSKLLPEGGNMDAVNMTELHQRMSEAVKFSRTAGRLRRDDAARQIWIAVYPTLSDAKPGLLGAILSRSEAHVMRLSSIYALLDCSDLVRKEHLLAALAVWEYSEASAWYIFRDKAGDNVEDRLYDALRIRDAGMTKTDIHNLFSRHVTGERIDAALDSLLKKEKVFFVDQKDATGRNIKRFYAAKQRNS